MALHPAAVASRHGRERRRRRGPGARPQAPPDDRRDRSQYRGAGVQQGGGEHLRTGQCDREGAALGLAARRGGDDDPAGGADGAARRRGGLGGGRPAGLIADAPWPEADPALLVEDEVTIAIQVNGKLQRHATAPPRARRARSWRRWRWPMTSVQRILAGAAPAQGDRRARPAGEHRRMKARARLARSWLLALAGCRLRPLYAGGAPGRSRRRCAASRSRRSTGRAGWLVRTALVDRLGSGSGAQSATGSRSSSTTTLPASASARDNAVTRERRTLRARYRLIDAARGTVLLDATAGSDAGIDVVSLRICDRRGRADRARAPLRRGRRPDRLPDRALCLAQRRGAGASEGEPGRRSSKALKAPGEIRFFLLHGPDESGSRGAGQGAGARRWAPRRSGSTSAGAELKADPARLADEAASISMFGGARWILVEPAGDEIAAGARGAARGAGGGQSGGGGGRRPQAGLEAAQARARRAECARLRQLRRPTRAMPTGWRWSMARGAGPDRAARRRPPDRRVLRRQPRADRPGARQVRALCRRLARDAQADRP